MDPDLLPEMPGPSGQDSEGPQHETAG